MLAKLTKHAGIFAIAVLLAGCSGGSGLFGGGDGDGLFARGAAEERREARREANLQAAIDEGLLPDPNRESIFDLFENSDDPNNTVEVNRYLWNASLEILNFMPVEAADPFSGVIQFGYGTPPGGRTAYRATVYVQDPALEARSLRVSVQSRSGAVSRDVARQIEDAILTRARQLRIRDANL
ncbi:DUF3576 domain-containing protein [Rhodobacterales bacterium LSUCC0031]|nr:DUF3576 domain-containing protein [Rhodobacterales bacterium LSUCC0031]